MTLRQVYTVEVDVAIARPPTPQNTRTVRVVVSVPADLPDWQADAEAQLIACQIAACDSRVVMPVASRIVGLEL